MVKRLVIALLVCVGAVGLVVAGALLGAHLLTSQTPLVEGCKATVGEGTTDLSVSQSENAALISAVAVRRGYPPRAATIALATAFQESGLDNIDYGDRDSLGLFQQRPSQGWGTREQILDPYYAAGIFYEHLVKVSNYSSMPIAEAAQKVQRSADGLAYAQHEPSARALASSFTGHSPAAFSCTLTSAPSPDDTAAPDTVRRDLAQAFGVRAVSAKDLSVPVDSRTRGWAVAHWAVAHAKRLGLTSVSYGGRRWTAADSSKGWTKLESTSTTRVLLTQPGDK